MIIHTSRAIMRGPALMPVLVSTEARDFIVLSDDPLTPPAREYLRSQAGW